jgi:hypothetical protein
MNTSDLVGGILSELAVTHKGVKVPFTLIVDAEDDRVVFYSRLRLKQLIRLQELHLELAIFAGYQLAHPLFEANLLYVVLLVRCVHHHGNIIRIFLFGDACVDSKVAIT